MDELVKDLTLDMLPEGICREIAEAIGIENFYTLTKIVRGDTVYLPKPESITRPARDARIRKEFNGYNHQDLAKKYRVSKRWVLHLCGRGKTGPENDAYDTGKNSTWEEPGCSRPQASVCLESGQKGHRPQRKAPRNGELEGQISLFPFLEG